MPLSTRALRHALPVCVLALAVSAAPTLAFHPTVTVVTGGSGESLTATELSARGGNIGVSVDWSASADPNEWGIETLAQPLATGLIAVKGWTGSDGVRGPDIACVANDEVATAWFKPAGSGFHVRVRTRQPAANTTSPQSFDLGAGSASRGLAIATLKDGYYPQIGADGERVVVSYMDRASLKVRRSTNRGASFGSAKMLRFEGFLGEIGVFPLTVAVHGSKVVIGAVESSPFGGKGLGYLSKDGGSSYTKVSQHSSGRIVAGMVRVGSSYHYAEAWDESISQPDPQQVCFRRQ